MGLSRSKYSTRRILVSDLPTIVESSLNDDLAEAIHKLAATNRTQAVARFYYFAAYSSSSFQTLRHPLKFQGIQILISRRSLLGL